MASYVPLIVIVLLIGALLALYLSPGARRARALKATERRQAEEVARAARAQKEAERKQAEEALIAQAQALYDLFVTNDGSPVPDLTDEVHGVILKEGETCCAMSTDAQHIVSRKKTQFVGGSQGVSVRIAKGVRYHVGGFRGHPVTEEFEVVADLGSVYVTNKRFIFAGAKEVTSVPVQKIADVNLDGARVTVIVENKASPTIVGITQPYRAPVIAAAAQCMAQRASRAKAPANRAG